MKFIENIKRLERIDQLIRLKATGCPHDLAQRLNISESQLYTILKFMKEDMGAPIFYSKEECSYCYHTSVKFICTFKVFDDD